MCPILKMVTIGGRHRKSIDQLFYQVHFHGRNGSFDGMDKREIQYVRF